MSKRYGHSPDLTLTSPPEGKFEISNHRTTRELQALREKLNLSEKLNTALKYELEANKRLATTAKSGSTEDPLMKHLDELRQLRSRLEESIKTYDELCLQLEKKLKELGTGDGKEAMLKERIPLMQENEKLRLKVGRFNEEMKLIQQQLEEHRLTRKRYLFFQKPFYHPRISLRCASLAI